MYLYPISRFESSKPEDGDR